MQNDLIDAVDGFTRPPVREYRIRSVERKESSMRRDIRVERRSASRLSSSATRNGRPDRDDLGSVRFHGDMRDPADRQAAATRVARGFCADKASGARSSAPTVARARAAI